MHGACSLTSLGAFLPPEPRPFPTGLSPAQEGLAPYVLQQNFLENETTSFFFLKKTLQNTYAEGGNS